MCVVDTLSIKEDSSELDLVDAAFQHKTESKYPVKCRETRKRAIRKKAGIFIVRDSVMFLFQIEKEKGSYKYANRFDGIMDYHPILHHRL